VALVLVRQPDKPERAILADPVAWYNADPVTMGAENYVDCSAAVHDPAVLCGMLEEYRAGLGLDRAADEADRAAGRHITCPTLVLCRSGTTSMTCTATSCQCGVHGPNAYRRRHRQRPPRRRRSS
jgi:hypothetical protein